MQKRSEALKARDLYLQESITNDKIRINVDVDRTIEEQIIHRKLVQKLRELRTQGQQNLRIVNGKIIEVFRPSLQQCWNSVNTANKTQCTNEST